LKEVIKAVGMDPSIITARSFRSGGATSGIEHGADAAQLMKVGRWKTTDVFFGNYVAVQPHQDTTDRMLGSKKLPIQDIIKNSNNCNELPPDSPKSLDIKSSDESVKSDHDDTTLDNRMVINVSQVELNSSGSEYSSSASQYEDLQSDEDPIPPSNRKKAIKWEYYSTEEEVSIPEASSDSDDEDYS